MGTIYGKAPRVARAGAHLAKVGVAEAAPNPLGNPFTVTEPGDTIFRPPPETNLVTLEQNGAGAVGGSGNIAAGGTGGGAGAYAKFTLGGALIASGSYLTLHVGGPGVVGSVEGQSTWVKSSAGAAKVESQGGNIGNSGGSGGTNIVTAGAGLTVLTNTAGGNGGVPVGDTGGAGGASPSGGAGGKGGAAGADGAAGVFPGGGGGAGGLTPPDPLVGGEGAGGRIKVTLS